MPDEKGECTCNMMARFLEQGKWPVKFDERLNEYHLFYSTPNESGHTIIHFCPTCGGSMPKSKRGEVIRNARAEKTASPESKPRLVEESSRTGAYFVRNPAAPEPLIDTSKRYDIYCIEPDRKTTVFRNALFKGGGSLPPAEGARSFGGQFVEIAQSNGQSVFVPRNSIFRFCEPGTELPEEPDKPKK